MFLLFFCCALADLPASEPRFALYSADGRVIPGAVDRMDASGAITMSGAQPVEGAQVLGLRRLDGLRPAFPLDPHLVLANGDRIVGQPAEVVGAFLILRLAEKPPQTQRLRFPLISSTALWLRSPVMVDRDPRHHTNDPTEDRLLLRNGDSFMGVLTGFDPSKKELVWETGGARRPVAIDKAAAVLFGGRSTRVRKPSGMYWLAVLNNGTRLTLVSAAIEKGELLGQTMYKDPVHFPLTDLAALDVYQGNAVYLSDLKPTRYEYRSYLGEQYEWNADRALNGAELQLQSAAGLTTFDKGLSTHADNTLTFAVPEKSSAFECQVGLDPHRGARGSALLSVMIDGRAVKINEGKPVTLATGIVRVRIDIANAKEIKLVAERGDGGNVGDFLNWADARFVR